MKESVIVVFGAYDDSYPRERILKRGLHKAGAELIECKVSPSRTAGWRKVVFIIPVFIQLTILFLIRTRKTSVDYLFIPRNNHALLPMSRVLSNFMNMTLVYDAFDPLAQTAIMKEQSRWRILLLSLFERISLKNADLLVATTESFAHQYESMYDIPRSRFVIAPPGADEAEFQPSATAASSDEFVVLYWGSFHPHHGTETIVRAAAELDSDREVRIILAGDGMARSDAISLADSLETCRIEFPGRVSDERLQALIQSADVCLGIFSGHELAMCSITNKVCVALAAGKPVITEDSPAIENSFVHGEHLYTVSTEDPTELAAAIHTLREDEKLRRHLGHGGRSRFEEAFSVRVIGEKLLVQLRDARQNGRKAAK